MRLLILLVLVLLAGCASSSSILVDMRGVRGVDITVGTTVVKVRQLRQLTIGLGQSGEIDFGKVEARGVEAQSE